MDDFNFAFKFDGAPVFFLVASKQPCAVQFCLALRKMPLKNLTSTVPAPIFRVLDQERVAIISAAAEGAITQKLSGKRTDQERSMRLSRLSKLWRAVVANANYPPKGRAG
jgi:hypothetical protein